MAKKNISKKLQSQVRQYLDYVLNENKEDIQEE